MWTICDTLHLGEFFKVFFKFNSDRVGKIGMCIANDNIVETTKPRNSK